MLEYLPSFERDLLTRLRLNASDAARICGITPRQLKYWTVKGFVPAADESEHCYDINAIERAILIRRVMDEGYTLEMANKTVSRSLVEEAEERRRLEELGERDLKYEISGYLEHLEGRIASLRSDLPAFLTLSRLGETALPPHEKALEQFFRENPFSFDTAQSIALRLGYAADDVIRILEELTRSGVLVRSEGEAPVYRLHRKAEAPS